MLMRRTGLLLTVSTILVLCAYTAYAATTATVTVTATVQPGQNDISLDTTTLNFGAVSGSVNDRRFLAGPVKVSYFAGTNPWTIRVYTANAGDVPGLIGQSNPAVAIPLKVWCENYGPTGTVPDEENTYFWNGYDFSGDGQKDDIITDGSISEIDLGFDVNGDKDALDTGLGTPADPVSEEASWLRIPDDSQMQPGQPFTWRRLTYAGAELDSDGFPVYLGIDIVGVLPQDYSTSTLTFQIINE